MSNYELVVRTLLGKFAGNNVEFSQINGGIAMQDNDVVCFVKPLIGKKVIKINEQPEDFIAYVVFLNDGNIPFDLSPLLAIGPGNDLDDVEITSFRNNENVQGFITIYGSMNSISGQIFKKFLMSNTNFFIHPEEDVVFISDNNGSRQELPIDTFLEDINCNYLGRLFTSESLEQTVGR